MGTPAAVRARAVPPVERISTPKRQRPRAKSARPLLSETLSSARRMGRPAMLIGPRSGRRPERRPAARSSRRRLRDDDYGTKLEGNLSTLHASLRDILLEDP